MSAGRGGSQEPVPLRDALAAVGRDLGVPAPDAFSALTNAWREIVGELLAAHAEVRSVHDGVCTVEVDGPGWGTQVRYSERQLVERAAKRCGPGLVTSIRVVVRDPGSTAP